MGFLWNPAKNEALKHSRGVTFPEILTSRFLGVQDSPSRANQWILLFELRGYIWAMPCVVSGEEVFLKTIYPCPKWTKLWRAGKLT